MITRKKLPTVVDRLSHFPAVGLFGPRQVGKTTLAKLIAEQLPSVYLDLENPSTRTLLDDPTGYLLTHADKLVILDEFQRKPEIFRSLRGIIDERRYRGSEQGRFLLLGSASLDLLKQSRESLAGRIIHVELSSFNALEVEPKQMDELWIRGGFPTSFLADNDFLSSLWRDSFVRTYLERDIPQFGPRIESNRLRRFWTMLAHQQGCTFNASSLARALEIDGKTVGRYLDLMVELLLVRRLPPYYTNVGKRLVKSPKIYIRDSGIVHALLGLPNRDSLLSHPVVGGSWEGFVIENLISVLPDNVQTWFYRTQVGAEIDLLLEIAFGRFWAIEIKRSLPSSLDRGFHHARNDVNPERSFVVHSGDAQYLRNDGVELVGLHDMMSMLAAL